MFSTYSFTVKGSEEKLNIFLTQKVLKTQVKINDFLFKSFKIRNNKVIFQIIKKIPRNLNGKITYTNLPN